MPIALVVLVNEIEKISSIMSNEYIALKATLHALDNRKYICGECKMKYTGRGYTEDHAKKYRASMACEVPSPKVLHRIDSIGFKKCIGNYFDYSAIALLEAYERYDKGTMPYPGSYMDQPNKVVDAFRIIGNHKTEKLIAQQEEHIRQSRMNRNGR